MASERVPSLRLPTCCKHFCKKCRPEVFERIRLTTIGRSPWNKGLQKVQIAWNKGLKIGQMSDEHKYAHSVGAKKHFENPENRAKHSRALMGRKVSIETRQKIAIARAKYLATSRPWAPTNLEYALQLLLESANLEFEAQKRFDRYIVDAYVPELNIAFEADGTYWHRQKQERDQKRDRHLIKLGINAVVRLDENDLDSWTEV